MKFITNKIFIFPSYEALKTLVLLFTKVFIKKY